MKIDLKDLRDKAQRRDGSGKLKSITREELALMLEETLGKKVHVTQIARYEDDPSNVPIDILIAWLRCLGTSIEELVLRSTTTQPQRVIDPGDPFAKLRSRISLLMDYLEHAGDDPALSDLPDGMPNLDDIRQLCRKIGRKPNVVLSGAFDVGKSTLANWLMTSDNPLPTQYQPTTAVVTYVRHMNDKPDWLREDVVLLGDGFDPDLWCSQDHVHDNRVISGNLETLRQYGTHTGDRNAGARVDSALVFIDSPILQACNLIDFPGYQNNEEDSKRADKAIRHMNVLMYASTATGFMDAQDLTRLRYLLKALPEYERTSPGFPPLSNLFIIATHAGPQISDSQLFGRQNEPGLVDIATERIWRELEDIELSTRSAETGKPIDASVIRSRIFPFWRESASRTESLADAITELLSIQLPAVVHNEADRQVVEFKEGTGQRYGAVIKSYEEALADIEAAKALYAQKLANEKIRKRETAILHQEIIKRVTKVKAEHLHLFSADYCKSVDAVVIEKQIRARYGDNKKEAQQFMAGYIVNSLQSKSEHITKEKAEEIACLIEKYVSAYDKASAAVAPVGGSPTIEIPFDSRGAFIGGLAGLGSIGALSIWASSLGNLGGYILAAKTVGILSSLGIATGGTASVMALVATMGGPVTLVVGIAIALFFGLRALFGESWQTRLARQIVDHLAKENVEERFRTVISGYWDGTQVAFEKGAQAVEDQFAAELNKIGAIFEDPTKQAEATRLVEIYKKAKDFFAGMPWIPVRPGLPS
jgi:hypothetical protein